MMQLNRWLTGELTMESAGRRPAREKAPLMPDILRCLLETCGEDLRLAHGTSIGPIPAIAFTPL